MMELLSHLTELTPVVTEVTIPDVKPDMTSNFATAIFKLAAIVLGVATGIAVIATIVAVCLMSVKALPSNMREAGASALGWCLFALVALGSLTGLAGWAVNFQIF